MDKKTIERETTVGTILLRVIGYGLLVVFVLIVLSKILRM